MVQLLQDLAVEKVQANDEAGAKVCGIGLSDVDQFVQLFIEPVENTLGRSESALGGRSDFVYGTACTTYLLV